MRTFKAQRIERADHPPVPGGESRRHPVRAPGHIVMVLLEGSCWVRRQDGSRENLPASSVVIWEPGDLVEYGYSTGEGYKAESFWSEDFSEQEWAAIITDVFGPDANK